MLSLPLRKLFQCSNASEQDCVFIRFNCQAVLELVDQLLVLLSLVIDRRVDLCSMESVPSRYDLPPTPQSSLVSAIFDSQCAVTAQFVPL